MIPAFLILLQTSENRAPNCWLAPVQDLIFQSIYSLVFYEQHFDFRYSLEKNRMVFLIIFYNSDFH